MDATSGTAPGACGELVVGARVVLVYDEPELDLVEGQSATLTRVDLDDREVEFVLDDGREFTADAFVVTPAPDEAPRSAHSLEAAVDTPALW